MNLVRAPRAATILYTLLLSRAGPRRWLLPANICPIVPLTFMKAQVPFEFVDISPQTLNMDMECAIGKVRAGEVGGVLYAHTYGEPSTPVDAFAELKRLDQSLLVIDDRCLCIPELAADVTNSADVLLYSTGYAKIVELGFGGYAFISDGVPYNPVSIPYHVGNLQAVESACKQAIARREVFHYKDGNWLETDRPMPDWEAYRATIAEAVSRSMEGKRQINAVYASMLPPEIQINPDYQTWRFNIRVSNQARILECIFAAQLFASSHYVSLAGVLAPGGCSEAERLAAEVVNLFNDYHYTPEMAEQTSRIILETLNAG